MWARLLPLLGEFPSAVLTAVDAGGALASVRTALEPLADRQVIGVASPAAVELCAGPACLLLHSHSEQLWDLRSVLVRGALEQDGAGWVFRPLVVTAGLDNSPLALARALLRARASAGRYLARRGLARPRVPWAALKAARAPAEG